MNEAILKAFGMAVLGPVLILFAYGFAFLMDLLVAWPLKWAWNYVIPAMFGLKPIGYWQAFCLIIVFSILVKPAVSLNSGSKS